MSALGEYLKAAKALAWQWRSHDCCAWPARWAEIDLPPYDDEAGAAALIGGAGGLVRLIELHAGKRLVATDVPQAGDLGVIRLLDLGEWKEVGAIFTGKRWAFVPYGGGIAAVSLDAVRAWDCGKRGMA